MRTPRAIFGSFLALCAIAFFAEGACAASELDVSGPAQSITARTLTVRDPFGSSKPWTVSVDAKCADMIVFGLPVAVDEQSSEVEIPFLVVVPKDGSANTTAMITVMSGDQVILTEAIEIHRTANPADINHDGRVDAADLTALLSNWGRCVKRGECAADIDGDGWIDGRDVSILVASWHS